eukprot:761776-Hanusia_phi.AAC.5
MRPPGWPSWHCRSLTDHSEESMALARPAAAEPPAVRRRARRRAGSISHEAPGSHPAPGRGARFTD